MEATNTELSAVLNRHGVAGQVILLGRRDDVPYLMNGLDIHVLSSRAEGFPNVVAEAMASGVACVVTDVGDAALLVDHASVVAPPPTPPALSGAIDNVAAMIGTRPHAEPATSYTARV